MARAQKEPEHGLPSLSLVFGYIAVKELQRIEDRILVLDRLGYGNVEIAAICGKSPNIIAVRKSMGKKRQKSAGKARRSKK